MLPVTRITDSVSCGDIIATGSGNVFVNNLPCARLTDKTTGHGCWPSTTLITGSGSVFVNNLPISRLTDKIQTHCCPGPPGCHNGVVSTGSGNVFSG